MLSAQVLAPARSVILASGTLAPIASLQQQLFPHVPPERMRLFSCGHVVLHRPCVPPQLDNGFAHLCMCHPCLRCGTPPQAEENVPHMARCIAQAGCRAYCKLCLDCVGQSQPPTGVSYRGVALLSERSTGAKYAVAPLYCRWRKTAC